MKENNKITQKIHIPAGCFEENCKTVFTLIYTILTPTVKYTAVVIMVDIDIQKQRRTVSIILKENHISSMKCSLLDITPRVFLFMGFHHKIRL